jgi:hypothetical protein
MCRRAVALAFLLAVAFALARIAARRLAWAVAAAFVKARFLAVGCLVCARTFGWAFVVAGRVFAVTFAAGRVFDAFLVALTATLTATAFFAAVVVDLRAAVCATTFAVCT